MKIVTVIFQVQKHPLNFHHFLLTLVRVKIVKVSMVVESEVLDQTVITDRYIRVTWTPVLVMMLMTNPSKIIAAVIRLTAYQIYREGWVTTLLVPPHLLTQASLYPARNLKHLGRFMKRKLVIQVKIAGLILHDL